MFQILIFRQFKPPIELNKRQEVSFFFFFLNCWDIVYFLMYFRFFFFLEKDQKAKYETSLIIPTNFCTCFKLHDFVITKLNLWLKPSTHKAFSLSPSTLAGNPQLIPSIVTFPSKPFMNQTRILALYVLFLTKYVMLFRYVFCVFHYTKN